ncbi:hypothetical protein BJV78DRAFT_1250814 [Lactifluus subvellereus]|nr:hypothetical protein BJV78DRAFT_1250814 [Lactifluus subvellereus]
MPLPPYAVYSQQLASLCKGCALWEPDPGQLYDHVSIGDVGYVHDGYFIRMFNVLLPWDDPLNGKFRSLERYDPLLVDDDPFINTRTSTFGKANYCSSYVTTQVRPRESNLAGNTSVLYRCKRKFGAFVNLPCGGRRTDAIRTKVFENYIRDHIDSWFALAQRENLDVQRMEDIILVSGCTLVSSWAAAAFYDDTLDARISLESIGLPNGGADIRWGSDMVNPGVAHHNSSGSTGANQCVFIRGFRAKRILFYMKLRGAAEPRPDDPDNRGEDEVQVMRVPDDSSSHDPLIGVLNYIAQNCPENTVAIAHHDDLHAVEGVETLSADTVEEFLRSKGMGVLVESGGAILRDDEGPPVPDEAKAIFYAQAESAGESKPLILHPVLSKYLLNLDITNHPDYDYDLPQEEVDSPATHPPMPTVILENRQGYPRSIVVQASSYSPDIGVTVQDVLRTIHEDARKQPRRNELNKLETEERARINASFTKRCKTEEELSQGPHLVDYLCGRDRLMIVPNLHLKETLPQENL